MNHKPYFDWLFEEADMLTTTQSKALQEHLGDCNSCQSLSDSLHQLETVLSRAEQVGPEAGFSTRWQARMVAHREQTQHRQILATLIAILCGIFLLTGVFVYLAWPWLRTPNLLIWTWIYQWFTLYAAADAVRDTISALFRGMSSIIPVTGWVLSLGILSELAVLWVVSYRLLTRPRRVTK